jgi:hypothetical protein
MLGDEGAWEGAFAQGSAMSAEEVTAYALSEESPSDGLPAGGERDIPLTTDLLNAWCELSGNNLRGRCPLTADVVRYLATKIEVVS